MRTLLASVAALSLSLPSFAQETDKTICEVAKANPQFSTLVKAIEAAGLGETLEGEGPYTLLAPTNEAFAKLPAGKLEELLKPENREKLEGILKLHVIKKKITAEEVSSLDGQSIETCCPKGTKCEVTASGGKVAFSCGGNKANVVKADIMASNGVIHAIDAVLMPAEKGDKE